MLWINGQTCPAIPYKNWRWSYKTQLKSECRIVENNAKKKQKTWKNEVKTQKQYEKTATIFSRCRKTVEKWLPHSAYFDLHFPFTSKNGLSKRDAEFYFLEKRNFLDRRYEIVQSNFVFFSFAARSKEYQSMYWRVHLFSKEKDGAPFLTIV